MPGSPPNRTKLSGTSPPPKTRSSSPIPVERRFRCCGVSSPLSVASSSTHLGAPPFRDGTAASRPPTTSSTKVFQLPQPGQRPSHFGELVPHSWQEYWVRALLILWPSRAQQPYASEPSTLRAAY